jgi:amino acid permease
LPARSFVTYSALYMEEGFAFALGWAAGSAWL